MNRLSSYCLLILALLSCSLAGCKKDAGTAQKTLNVYIWADYLPQSVTDDFKARTGIQVNITTYASNEELQQKLHSAVADYDIVVPSDYMLYRLVKQNLLRPLDRSKLTHFANLDPKFLDQKFDPANAHSVPYFWGTTGLGYNKKKTEGPIDSWNAVFDPRYKGRVLMLKDARECFAVALRTMGKSANETDPAVLKAAADKLKAQKPLVLKYDSEAFHEKLAAGDVIFAQGYGGQLAKVVADKPEELAYVIPKEGGTAWADSLCIPASARHAEAAYQFIDYVLEPEVAAKIANEESYATPNAAARKLIDPKLLNNAAIYPPDDVMARCQFMTDLGDAAKLVDQYWTEIGAN